MIYKIRVILNTEDDVFRDIEIKSNQTLGKLHEAIKSAFCLQAEELASFYKSDNNWNQGDEIPLEDMTDDGSGETMYDIYVKEVLPNLKSKILYVYDFMIMWSFYVEVLEITDKDLKLNYPLTVFRFGNVPLKAPNKNFSNSTDLLLDEDEDDLLLGDDDLSDLNFEELENFEDD